MKFCEIKKNEMFIHNEMIFIKTDKNHADSVRAYNYYFHENDEVKIDDECNAYNEKLK